VSPDRLEAAAEKALKGKVGTIIVADVKNGKILLCYDPQKIAAKKIQAGSTLKIITAFAALTKGISNAERKINCKGAGCWYELGHGPLNIIEALSFSCNNHFKELGRELGAKKLLGYYKAFGLLDLDKQYYFSNKEAAGMAIGENKDLLVSPLDMLSVVLTFASRGKTQTPKFRNHGAVFDLIREGMHEATILGTARALRDLKVRVAGKTGTVASSDGLAATNGWFVGYAPLDNPLIALVVFVQKGQGYSHAVPAAKKILKAYFSDE